MFQLQFNHKTNATDEIPQHYLAHENYIKDFCSAWLNGENVYTFYTSGSTGTPKQILLNREQLLASAMATNGHLNIDSNDSFLLCLEPKTIAGSMMLVRAMLADAPLTFINPSLDPLSVIDNNHAFTIASFVPAQLYNLTQYREVFNRFQKVLIGGSILPEHLYTQLLTCSTRTFHTYGMTETASHVALKEIGKDRHFHLLAGNEVRLDTRSCICLKGAATKNEWIATNDLGEVISNTEFKVLGRIDQVIITGGKKVLPEKVEQAISGIIQDAFFITSLPHPQWGEEIIMIVEREHQIDFESLKSHLLYLLKPHEMPKRIYCLDQFLRTPSGKIDKKSIIKQLIY